MKFFPRFSFALRLLFFFAVAQTLLRAWPGGEEKLYLKKDPATLDQQSEENRSSTIDNPNSSGDMTRGTGFSTARDSSYLDQPPSDDHKRGEMSGHMIDPLSSNDEREDAPIAVAQKKYSAIPDNHALITKISGGAIPQGISTFSIGKNLNLTEAARPPFSEETREKIFAEALAKRNALPQLLEDIKEAIYEQSLNEHDIFTCLKALDPKGISAEATCMTTLLEAAKQRQQTEQIQQREKALKPIQELDRWLLIKRLNNVQQVMHEGLFANTQNQREDIENCTNDLRRYLNAQQEKKQHATLYSSSVPPVFLLPNKERIPIEVNGNKIILPFLPSNLEIRIDGKVYKTPSPEEAMEQISVEEGQSLSESLQRTLEQCYGDDKKNLTLISQFFSSSISNYKLPPLDSITTLLRLLNPSLSSRESSFKERTAQESVSSNNNEFSSEELLELQKVLSVSKEEVEENLIPLNQFAIKMLENIPSPQQELLRTLFHGSDAAIRSGLTGAAAVGAGAIGVPLAPLFWVADSVVRNDRREDPLHGIVDYDLVDPSAFIGMMMGVISGSVIPSSYHFPYEPSNPLDLMLEGSLLVLVVTPTAMLTSISSLQSARLAGRATWNFLHADIPCERAREAFESFSNACENQVENILTRIKEIQTKDETHLQKIEIALHEMKEKRIHEKAPVSIPLSVKTTKIERSSVVLPSPPFNDPIVRQRFFQNQLCSPIKDKKAPEFTGPAVKQNTIPNLIQNPPLAENPPLPPKTPLTFSKVETIVTHFIESQRNIYNNLIAGLERTLQEKAKQQTQKEKNVSEAMGYTHQGKPTRPRPQF